MVDHLTIEVDDDNDDSFPYLLKESYIQQHESLRISYKACHDIIQQLSEDKVKDIAKEHGIYYNPIDECNSQRYYNVDWEDDIYPKLQRDVARYFCAKCEGVKYLSKYINANEEEAAEMEVDGMDLEVASRTTTSDSNNVDIEEDVGGAPPPEDAAAMSAVHFRPIANTVNEQDADIEQAGNGGDAENDNLDFGSGGNDDSYDGDELYSTHIKEDIQQSTVGVALDAPKPDIEILEESAVKEAARTKTKSPTSVDDTTAFDLENNNDQEEEQEEEEQQQQQQQLEDFTKFTIPELKVKLKKLKLPVSGRVKQVLIDRLHAYFVGKRDSNVATRETIPSNVPAKVESVEAAKERLSNFIKVKTTLERAVNEDERKEIRAAIKLVHREIDRVYPLLSKDYRDMLTPWDKNKKVVDDNIYDFDLGTKVGEGQNAEGRTNMQMPKYTTRSIVSNPTSEEVVEAILNLSLIMLKGHDSSRIDKTRRKIRRQVGEAIIHACYKVEGNVVLEFALQMPTDRVRLMVDTSAFTESLRKHSQYERLKLLFGRCTSVMDADTWATILSFLHENSEHIQHLLPQLDEHITKWLCEMNVDRDKYSRLENLYPLCPYYEHNKQDVLDMLKLVRDSSINNNEKATGIRVLLDKILARDHHEEPTKEEAATAGVQTLTNIFDNQSTSQIIRVRQCSLDAMKSCPETTDWFRENMKPSTAIELKCTKVEARSEAGVSTIGSNNEMTVYETKSGHVVLARKSSWPMFGNPLTTSLQLAFIATRGYMDESALMNEFDFLSSDKLTQIRDRMMSHTMLLTGLSGCLYAAIKEEGAGGSINNSKSYTLPRGVGGKGGQPPGIPSIQSTVFGGLYMYAIIQIYKMSIETHPNKTDEDFNKLAAILTGNNNFIEDGTTLNSRSSAKCPGLKAVGNLPALPCGKLFGPNNKANHAGKKTLGGGVNQLLCDSCCSRNDLKQKYELETLRLMEVRDRGQQIRFDLLTATLEKDEEKIKQCKLLVKEEKQRLKDEEKEQEQLAKKRKRMEKEEKQRPKNARIEKPTAEAAKKKKKKRKKKRKQQEEEEKNLETFSCYWSNDILPPYYTQWPGNIHFQHIIGALKPYYQSNQAKQSEMVDKVLSTLKSQGRRFITQVGHAWTELDDDAAKERCIQALNG